jgi:hypothetical protein
MKLTDFDKKVYAHKALSENYQMSFDTSSMTKNDTQKMLQKVRSLAMEAKESSDFHRNQTSPSYMKLVFMEQALVQRYNELLSQPRTRIVVENEEVEKSQVVLAAQDLVDTMQKMLEDIGQMQVKELPALVDSIESEIGVNEAQSYNDQVSSQLDTLSGALKAAFAAMKSARDSITGQGGGFADAGLDAGLDAGMDDEMAGMDAGIDADMGADMDADLGADIGADLDEPEPTAGGAIGRAKR